MLSLGRGGSGWRRGQDYVAVGPARAEGADTGDKLLAGWPARSPTLNAKAELVQGDLRIGSLEVEAARDRAALDRQRRLDQPGDPGGPLEVADVGLHGADRQPLAPGVSRPEDRAQGRGLDRVADRRPAAVQLDVGDLRRVHAGVAIGLGENRLLRRLARRDQRRTAAVVVDGAAANRAVDPVPVRPRGGERLEQDDSPALAPEVAVGARVEGRAATARGERAEPRRHQGGGRVDVQLHAARQRQSALAPTQALAGEVDRHQRGGLGRVHREARPGQAKTIGDAVGDHRPVQTGRQVAIGEAGAGGESRVVARDRAEEDAGGGAAQATGRDAGVLDRLPAQLQRQSLLGVHRRSLARRDPKEGGVEAGHVVEEGAEARGSVALGETPVGVAPCQLPALGGNLADRLLAALEKAPEGLRVRRPGKPTSETDDGDRVGPANSPYGHPSSP